MMRQPWFWKRTRVVKPEKKGLTEHAWWWDPCQFSRKLGTNDFWWWKQGSSLTHSRGKAVRPWQGQKSKTKWDASFKDQRRERLVSVESRLSQTSIKDHANMAENRRIQKHSDVVLRPIDMQTLYSDLNNQRWGTKETRSHKARPWYPREHPVNASSIIFICPFEFDQFNTRSDNIAFIVNHTLDN